MKKIVLTGGGTAGHVTPNIALLPALREADYDIHYIGSFEGIESRLIPDFDVPYYGISTGKFRRYFDLKNFSDPFRVIKGYRDAKKILKELKPDVVFSKGGFVAVPVVRAAADLKIPCIIHESDMTPGLANKLCIPAATKVCCNFPETLQNLPTGKAVLTGTPIRSELTKGNKIAALDICGFTSDKPVIMVVGGSQGSASINQVVREALPKLLEDFQVLHICGKDKVDNLMLSIPGYKQFEGKSVAQIAKEMGKSCLDAYLDLCEMSDFKGRINMGPYSTPEIVSELSKDDRCLYMTDAWVEDHGIQNPAIYDCFPKFLKFSLCGTGDTMPNTIRKMTGAVADRFSIKDRGQIRPGYFADLTVFDETKLREGQPDNEKPFGIEKVYINGIKVLDNDVLDAEAIRHSGRAKAE